MSAEHWFLLAGIALCLFSLWAIAQHDWLRLTRPTRRAIGEVCGHRSSNDGDGIGYAAIYRFTSESGTHEVIDTIRLHQKHPPLGTKAELVYPEGRPDLARRPQLVLWVVIYAFFLALLGLLTARLLGWLPA